MARDPREHFFTVHRLVQDVTRRSLGENWRSVLADALSWIDAAFVGVPDDVRFWPVLEPLAPHVRAVVAFSDAVDISEPTGRLMHELGGLLDAKAQPVEAEPLMRRALEINEKKFGPNHSSVTAGLGNLAGLLLKTDRSAEAELLSRRALAIDEERLGSNHPTVATRLNNLASILNDTGRRIEAEQLVRRALAIDEASLGPDHPNVAIRLNNLASILYRNGRFVEAEPLYRRALAMDERNLGSDHPNVGIRTQWFSGSAPTNEAIR